MPHIDCHKLRVSKGNQRPNRMLFIDIETEATPCIEGEMHYMKMGWSYYVNRNDNGLLAGGQWVSHKNDRALCEYIVSLTQKKTALYLFAHNIYFDLQASGFFHYLSAWGWKLKFIYDKGLTYILVLKKDKFTIKALSTTNWFDFSLAKLGETMNLPKLEMDFDDTNPESLSRYCKRDVEIMIAAMRDYLIFLDENDAGSFGMTKASQSFKCFTHRFMHNDIVIHRDNDVIAFERKAYMGGRTEAFYIGQCQRDRVIVLDINSMYPYIMANHLLPSKLLESYGSMDLDMFSELISKYAIIAEVDLDTPEPAYAVRDKDKLIYPIGKFRAHLCTPGLRYALAHGHLKKIHIMQLYEQANLFQSYVHYWYDLRQQYQAAGNEPYAQMVKIFLNSLYGKFGQKRTKETRHEMDEDMPYFRMDIYDLIENTKKTITGIMNMIIIAEGEENTKDAFVPIPAHITEYARFLLWDIIKSIGRDKVLYCDTDSVFIYECDLPSVKWPMHDTELGALAIDSTYSNLVIHGLKDYEADGMVKLKGVPKKHSVDKRGDFHYKQFAGQATHLRKRVDRGFLVRYVSKSLTREYTKGTINPDGSIAPFVFPLDDQ